MSAAADPSDDRLHAPTPGEPLFSETSWYGFHVAERTLAGTVYPLFRPNLGVASLSVYVWDAQAHEPWRVPYGRCLWHLPMPEGDLDDLALGGLHLRCEESGRRYRVRYRDGERLELDLTYQALRPAHRVAVAEGRGHLDQPCRVRGTLALHGETIAVDCLDMRDRSWHVRDDTRTTRASYSYAVASADEAFLAGAFLAGGESRIVTGYLVRDGEKADLVAGTRTLRAGRAGWPERVTLTARDRLGRSLEAEGRCVARLANQATPGMFAWMSLTDWTFSGLRALGEDQDVWSPDLLGA